MRPLALVPVPTSWGVRPHLNASQKVDYLCHLGAQNIDLFFNCSYPVQLFFNCSHLVQHFAVLLFRFISPKENVFIIIRSAPDMQMVLRGRIVSPRKPIIMVEKWDGFEKHTPCSHHKNADKG